MKTEIYYYSGTGNSLWISRILSKNIKGAKIYSIFEKMNQESEEKKNIGIVFPVHMWGVPEPVVNFLNEFLNNDLHYYFGIAVNGGQVASTLIQLKKIFLKKNLKLNSGFQIEMPGNYIPMGGPGDFNEQRMKNIKAEEKIKRIAVSVRNKEDLSVEKGPVWQNIIFPVFYKITYSSLHKFDKDFTVDDKCNLCGVCVKICRNNNIVINNGKIEWHNRCNQCFSCIQWCSQEAIQCSKKSSKIKRYHHPSVKLADMIGDK